ncbi:hypothetical protein AB990_05545 [Alkalihalobacillus pseudalcaliphilus]|nr:hypothetical protein AB990_05545 [Alkalihalobacillus pseudalcaliphilus]
MRLNQDIVFAEKWYQDAEILKFSEGSGTKPYSIETVERMYKYLLTIGEVYMIEVYEEENNSWIPIGDVTLADEMIPIIIGEKQFQGKGYGKMVIQLLQEYARHKGWKKLKVSKVYSYNISSKKLFESCGFKEKSQFKDDHGRDCVDFERHIT